MKRTVVATMAAVLLASTAVSMPQVVVHVAREADEATIERAFTARSEPSSGLFRQHLSKEELRELVRGREVSLRAVEAYLRAEGATELRELSTGDAIVARVPPRSALGLRARASRRGGEPRSVVRLADEVQQAHVRYAIVVWPRTESRRPPRRSAGADASGPQTPATITRRYRVPTQPVTSTKGMSVGVGEFETDFFLSSDMTTFATKWGLEKPKIMVMGPNPAPNGADNTEGTLDLQYMGAMLQNSIPIWWLAQNMSNNDPGNIDFSLWSESVLSLKMMPYVVSLSWGLGLQNYDGLRDILVADNDAFRKLGLLGVSVFAASGDDGPGNRDGVFNCATFVPSWPASSPYVTSVGATEANGAAGDETAVSWSGGGFSTAFGRPSYQDAAVLGYLANASGLPKASFYNRTGRAYPDVSALGVDFGVYVSGQWMSVDGTSASSPTFAGVVARIVAERLEQGKPALGFLNPKLYELGKVGFDVVVGASVDMNCIPGIPERGFPTAPGWDAVTGLGTPDLEFLSAHL